MDMIDRLRERKKDDRVNRIEKILTLKKRVSDIDDIINALEDAFVWERDDCGYHYWDQVRTNLRYVRDKIIISIQKHE